MRARRTAVLQDGLNLSEAELGRRAFPDVRGCHDRPTGLESRALESSPASRADAPATLIHQLLGMFSDSVGSLGIAAFVLASPS
jgi:hypothetical protein